MCSGRSADNAGWRGWVRGGTSWYSRSGESGEVSVSQQSARAMACCVQFARLCIMHACYTVQGRSLVVGISCRNRFSLAASDSIWEKRNIYASWNTLFFFLPSPTQCPRNRAVCKKEWPFLNAHSRGCCKKSKVIGTADQTNLCCMPDAASSAPPWLYSYGIQPKLSSKGRTWKGGKEVRWWSKSQTVLGKRAVCKNRGMVSWLQGYCGTTRGLPSSIADRDVCDFTGLAARPSIQ